MLFVVSLLFKLALASGNPIFMLLTVKVIRIAFTQSILAISTELPPQKAVLQRLLCQLWGSRNLWWWTVLTWPGRFFTPICPWELIPSNCLRDQAATFPVLWNSWTALHFSGGTERRGPCNNAQRAWVVFCINFHVFMKHSSRIGKSGKEWLKSLVSKSAESMSLQGQMKIFVSPFGHICVY